MVSLRKKYSSHVTESAKDDAPIAATPRTATVTEPPPPPADDETPPAEPLKVEDPVRETEQSVIRQRLQEVERAESLQREALAAQRHAVPEPQAPPQDPLEAFLAGVPEGIRNWLRAH